MTATLSLNEKGQWVLPKKVFQQAHLRPGSKVRISHVEEGVLLSPVEQSWEEELQAVIKATGYPSGPEPKNAAKRIKQIIQRVRRGA
ncbi:MAG: hypothetical protein HZA90_08165 [Verrucomicrobia bacterium]|nr:hypothetical protein [Verrucomicrobiota bacterium]